MKTAVSEKKSVKTLKGQLFGAVSMMLVAAIALGTSTYAWFVSNSTVAVDPMQLTVSSSQYLQIAVKAKTEDTGVDNGQYTAYKNLIIPADITGLPADGGAGWTSMLSAGTDFEMVPASTVTTVTDSSFFYSLGGMEGTSLSTFGPVDIGVRGNETQVKKIVFSFKSSTDTDVFFGGMKDAATGYTTLADFLSDVPDTTAGQAAAIAKALRIAVVADNTGDYTGDEAKASPVIFQFTTDAPAQVGNTLYPDATAEPAPPTIDEPTGKYRAIATVDEATHLIKTTGAQEAELPAATKYLVPVTAGTNGAAPEVKPEADSTALFSLTAEKPRDVAVYIWLEGTDGDCMVDLASNTFNLTLPFAAGEIPTT